MTKAPGKPHIRPKIDIAKRPYADAHCHSGRDGDCIWEKCPQKIRYQSYCPLATRDELDPDWHGA